MYMRRNLPLIGSIVFAGCLIGMAVYLRQGAYENRTGMSSVASKKFTAQELATFDGQKGRACYVAVDGKVYEIEQGRLWSKGQHTPSAGQAHCGKDLSDAIGKSPHGKSKLTALESVGSLVE